MQARLPHASQHCSSPFAASSSFFNEGNEPDIQQGSLQHAIERTYLRFVDRGVLEGVESLREKIVQREMGTLK